MNFITDTTIPQLLVDIETNVVYITDTATIIGYRNKCILHNTIPQLLLDIETNVVYVTQYHNYYWVSKQM